MAPAAAGAATGGQLIYKSPDGISGSPYGTLLGRPVIPHQACKQLGSVGDIIFAALPQYTIAVHNPCLKSSASIHLWFDQGVTAFRFTIRIGGQPWWSSAFSAKNGSTTYGPFVALAAR